MSAYILTLLAASVAACVIELLVPKGDGGKLAASVRMIGGLFLIIALIAPLKEGLGLLRFAAEGDVSDLIEEHIPGDLAGGEADYQATFQGSLAALGRGEVEAWVTESLSSRFQIPPSDCAVEAVVESEEGNLTLRELRIGLRGAHALTNPHPIEEYFSDLLGCPCYVTVLS